MTVETLYYKLKEEMRTGGKFKEVTITIPNLEKTVKAVNMSTFDDSLTIFMEPVNMSNVIGVLLPNCKKE